MVSRAEHGLPCGFFKGRRVSKSVYVTATGGVEDRDYEGTIFGKVRDMELRQAQN